MFTKIIKIAAVYVPYNAVYVLDANKCHVLLLLLRNR